MVDTVTIKIYRLVFDARDRAEGLHCIGCVGIHAVLASLARSKLTCCDAAGDRLHSDFPMV